MNLTIAEIAKAINGEIINNKNINIKNISTDSRLKIPDSLFFAIKGENLDGHEFISQAIENGALSAVVQKDAVNKLALQDLKTTLIAVDDTVQALLDTAKYYKSLMKNLNKTIAVTGSVGKTTAKEFIYSVLNEKFKTQKSEGNFNTETGLPYTLFSLGEDTEAIVLEMGMSAFGEIARLSKTANPNAAIITNIGTSHIEHLGSRENIKKAKFEILDGMDSNSNIILNADDELLYAEKNKTGRKEYFFGINNKDADFIAENIEFDYEKNISCFETDNFKFKIPAVGTHNIYNALPALITGRIYGLSNEEIQAGFDKFENAKMRQNIYDFNGITIIDDCYNASLESVLAALGVLRQLNKNKKIAVLSDILESGNYADEIHAKIGEAAVENNIDRIFVYGENSKMIYKTIEAVRRCECHAKCVYFKDKSEIARILYNIIAKDDAILFKASRGMAMETVLEDFKKLFS